LLHCSFINPHLDFHLILFFLFSFQAPSEECQ
jgi:hypothetical protein